MAWFWLGFFALVALLLVFDLGVLNRKAKEPTLRSAALATACWVALGLAFSGVVFLIYENNLGGAHLSGCPPGHADGADAAITYVSAYLLEQALSVDNLFVIALVFKQFRVPMKYQHRVLFWGILGAIGFRFALLGGGAYIAARFDWIFYLFGAYLVWNGIQLFRGGDDDGDERDSHRAVRFVRRFIRVIEGDFGGAFSVVLDGRRALTTVAVCLVVVELTDIVFAMDSIPAVLSVSQETFIMVTSNIFAILGLRSLYFVLAGVMAKFQYLEIALALLLVFIGAKMLAHSYYTMPHLLTLAIIAGVLGIGVVASMIAARRAPRDPIDPGNSLG
ncbi:MAG TPA: TerC/Alx family metal homeostasis membrane protein [Kofleriaceae bacterium]|jgi:tellurite resistance protein TerC